MNRHVAEVENLYRQMRGWRHDYHNHIQMMKAYRALGQDDRLDAYLDELEQDLKGFDVLIRSGNVMIDAVLNSKLSLAKSHGIAINAKAVVPQELSFPDIDLCVILGNLLDNAIEACQWLEEPASRFIRVYLDLKGENLYLCITNSTGKIQKAKWEIRQPESRTARIRTAEGEWRLISRYQGYLKRADEEGVFTCEVLLPPRQPSLKQRRFGTSGAPLLLFTLKIRHLAPKNAPQDLFSVIIALKEGAIWQNRPQKPLILSATT